IHRRFAIHRWPRDPEPGTRSAAVQFSDPLKVPVLFDQPRPPLPIALCVFGPVLHELRLPRIDEPRGEFLFVAVLLVGTLGRENLRLSVYATDLAALEPITNRLGVGHRSDEAFAPLTHQPRSKILEYVIRDVALDDEVRREHWEPGGADKVLVE